eukprot:TRINITY_DN55505_c0_g1_i1.p1 TRINITY_DN55505_c0_g1~~TRINITY_DN55505_c0_g1_i1.p1  ORF type:complete len:594 (+),score=139.94 TRINITY_DN55505_c0_g1_i1:127-1908(+)
METRSVASAVDSSLYAVAVLIDELRHDDVQVRLSSVRNLSTVAVALGPERAREELIPFLQEIIDDDDEVLLALADQLGKGISWVGGASFAHALVVPLEELCNAEEIAVRDKATAAICDIISLMQADQISRHIIPLITRLASHEWFTSRTSVCGLLAAAMKKVDESKHEDLLKTYYRLCGDDAPMVRRQAASVLGGIAEVFKHRTTPTQLLEVFQKLSKDEQDSVRILAITNCVALGKAKCGPEWKAQILEVIKGSAEDKSWRMRYMMADHVKRLCEAFPAEAATAVVPLHLKLLSDLEAEVRTIAAARISEVAAFCSSQESADNLLPCLEKLTLPKEPSQHVRASLAGSILGLAPILGPKLTVDRLISIVLHIIRDECPDVRLRLIGTLDDLSSVVGVDVLSQSLMPSVRELGKDPQWRVRLAIVEYMPALARQLGEEHFTPELCTLLSPWLADPVFSVRDAAAAGCRELARTLGTAWCEKHIAPLLKTQSANKNYLFRISAMLAMRTLTELSETWPALEPHLVPLAVQLASDPVPNVRFNAVKTIQAMYKACEASSGKTYTSTLAPCIRRLVDDEDKDVQYFARQAKESLGL